MKIIRYQNQSGEVLLGALKEDGQVLSVNGDLFGPYEVTEKVAEVHTLLAPLVPTTIFGIGLNYGKHAEETGRPWPDLPVVFFKGVNTVQDPEKPILLPRVLRSDEVDYECELAVIIGRACKNVTQSEALDYVLGYTCANDVSARDWQIKKCGGQWCRGKTFDTFCPLGPCLVTKDEILDPNSLEIKTELNGRMVQEGNTRDMIFSVPALIEFLSGSTTLLPGTVILTGTTSGVGVARKPPLWLNPGDNVTVEVEAIGRLTNPVLEEPIGN